MKTTSIALLSILLSLFSGCVTEGPYTPERRASSPEIENRAVILDEELSGKIAVDLLETEKTEKNKLTSIANLRNRTNLDLNIQVQTIFRDARGFSIGDDTSWETLVLTANETRTIRSTSTSSKSESFTLRVRMIR